jgi:hypothetical protein
MNEDRFKEALKYITINTYDGPCYEKKKCSEIWMLAFMDMVMDTDLTIEQIINQTDHLAYENI